MIYRFESSKKKIVIQGLDSETALIQAKSYCVSEEEKQSIRFIPENGLGVRK
jgi:hypothetical protein